MTIANTPLRSLAFEKSIALPNGAAAVNSASLDLANSPDGDFPGQFEVEVVAPALATADLPDTETMIYKITDSADDSSFADAEGLEQIAIQTGAGGAGAATDTIKIRLPKKIRRYVRLTATNSGSGDASDKSATIGLVL